MLKRILSLLLIQIMLLVCFAGSFTVSAASYDNTYQNTGKGQIDIAEVAKTQVGYYEGCENKGDTYTKYGDWYHDKYAGGDNSFINAPWCAMFVSWCSDQAGTDGVTGDYAYCPYWVQHFKDISKWKSRDSGYIPAKGDIIFFCWDGTGTSGHVGIVYDSNDSTVYTIEGNAEGDACITKQYSLTCEGILGYGAPAYSGRTEYSEKKEFALTFGSDLSIDKDKDYLLGVTDTTTAEDISSKLTNSNISFPDGKLGTGSIISLKDKSGNITDDLGIVIRGDLNGDGTVDSVDCLLIKKGVLGTATLSDIQYKAGCLSEDTMSSADYLMVKKYILGNMDIYGRKN